MKKAKIALTIVTMLGIAGGALAYKANRILTLFYTDTFTTTQPGGPIVKACLVSTYYQFVIDQGGTSTINAYTTHLTVSCPTLRVAPVF
jgi:hypothetical protein